VIVTVQPIGPVASEVLGCVAECVQERLGLDCRRAERPLDTSTAWDARRQQYSSFEFMRMLATAPHGGRILGVTECDLFIPALTFVFGQAQLAGPVALVSTARLRQEFYRLPPDDEVFRVRLRKEVVHELGHTLGLVHCGEFSCAMHLSTNVMQVDTKEDRLCASCRATALGPAHGEEKLR
jgi:archaemetzincin